METAGSSKYCTGHQGGCEAAVYSVVVTFNEEVHTEEVLQVGATSVSNTINRKVILGNIQCSLRL